jgi:predicted ATPase
VLRKFYVHNFKTLLNFTFQPKGVSLLIGRNNTGKTNLCQALRLLPATSSFKLSEALQAAAGGFLSVTNKYTEDTRLDIAALCDVEHDGQTYTFEYELTLDVPKGVSGVSPPRVSAETLRVTGGGFDATELLANDSERVRILNEPAWLDGARDASETYATAPAPSDSTALYTLYEAEWSMTASVFKHYLWMWHFFDFATAALRAIGSDQRSQILATDGSNLASVVGILKARDDRAYQEILDLVRTVEPGLEAITFDPSPSPDFVFMAFEDKERHKFYAPELSGGTLRLLALAYIIASNRSQSRERSSGPGLNVVEEPETGVFAGHLKKIFEAIDPSGRAGQYIFTTHQPYFIDLFDGQLDSVFLLKRERTHSVLVRPDEQKVREWLGEFSLGELHFREMLDA